MFNLVDYYYQNFDGLTRDTTKIRIPMKIWYGSIFLDKLDVIEFRDSVITGINTSTKWMVTKKTPKDIELINISKYSGNADNVYKNETVVYSPDTLPVYNHTGGEGMSGSSPDTTTTTISKDDSKLGTLGLVQIPLNKFSAKINIFATNVNNDTGEVAGVVQFKDIVGEDSAEVDEYSEMFFSEPGIEYIIKVDNVEFLQVKTIYGSKGYVTHRGLFETEQVNLVRGKIVQFYAIASKVNENGLSTHSLLVGNESGNHMKYDKGSLTVVSDSVDIQGGNINIENIITGDKMKFLSTKTEGTYSNEFLLGTADGSTSNFQVGNLHSNSMLRFNQTNSEILMGQSSTGSYELSIGNSEIDIYDIITDKFKNLYSREEILSDFLLYNQLDEDQHWRLKNYQKYMRFDGNLFQIGSNVELRGFSDANFPSLSNPTSITFDDLSRMYIQSTLGLTQFNGNAVKIFKTPKSPQLITSIGYMDASKDLESSEFVRIGKNAVPTFNIDGNRVGYKDGMWIGDLSNRKLELKNYMSYSEDEGLFISGNFTLQSSGKRIEDEITDYADQVSSSAEKNAKDHSNNGIQSLDDALKLVIQTKSDLAETTAKSYADGKISAEEARAIEDAQAKYDLAIAHATEVARLAEVNSKGHADGGISDLNKALNLVIVNKTNLAEVNAIAHADGIVSAEEARAIQDAQLKYELSISHATKVANDAEVNSKKYIDLELTNFVTDAIYSSDLADIQSQIDGNITSWFYEYEPTLTNKPSVDWKTNDEKNVHLGDLFYNLITGYSYRFTLNNTYMWTKITDTDVTLALSNAGKAQDTADGKRRVFVSTPITPYDVGDLWSDGVDLKKCIVEKSRGQTYSSSDWNMATKYTDDASANLALDKLSDMSSDNKITPLEKEELKRSFDEIEYNYDYLIAEADQYSIVKTKLVDQFDSLSNYIIPILQNMGITSDVVGGTYRTLLNLYYQEKNLVEVAINKVLSEKADWVNIKGTPTQDQPRNYAFENGVDGWSYSYEGEIVPNISESPDVQVVGELGTVGGNLLRISSPKYLFGSDPIPVDTNKKYKIEARVKISNAGAIAGTMYLGCACLDSNHRNINDGVGSHRYAGASSTSISSDNKWVVYSGYITGTSNSHKSFKTNTSYIRPVLIVNYKTGNSSYDIDYISFKEIGDEYDLKEQSGWKDLPSSGATDNSLNLEYSIPEAQLKFGQDALGYNTHGINITAGIGSGSNSKLTKFQIDSYTGNFNLESFGKVNIYNDMNRLYFDDEKDSSINRSQILLNTSDQGDSDVVFRLGDSMTYTKSDVLSFTNGSIALSENKTVEGKSIDFKTIINADTITSNSQEKTGYVQRITQLEGGDIFFSEVNSSNKTYSSRANIKLASGVVKNNTYINLATEHSNGVHWENPQVIVAPLNFDISGSTKYNVATEWQGQSFKVNATGISNSASAYFQYFAYESASGAGTSYKIFTTPESYSSTQTYVYTVPHTFTEIKACYSNLGTVSSWSVSGNKLTVRVTGSTNKIEKVSNGHTKTIDYAWNDAPSQNSYYSKWLNTPFPATYTGYLTKTGSWSKIYRSSTGSTWTDYAGQSTGVLSENYSRGLTYAAGSQIGNTWYGSNNDSYEYRKIASANTKFIHTDKYSLGQYELKKTDYKTQRRLVGKRWVYSGTIKAYTYKYNVTYLYVT